MSQIRPSGQRNLLSTLLGVALLAGLLLAATPAARAASTPSAGAADPNCLYYTVQRGDTLLEIAARYQTTVRAIQRANGLRTTRISVGQRLCIPRRAPAHPTTPSGGPWYAEYWNNTLQSGPASLVRNERTISYNWGFGSPDLSRIQPDNFSARWVRNLNFPGGVWRFTVSADDGFRLFIDNQLVLDFYTFVGQQQRSFDAALGAGLHSVRLDYVEYGGQANIRLGFTRLGPLPGQPGQPSDGEFNNGPWRAEYFSNPTLSGAPVFVTTHCCLRFNWRGNSPAPGVPASFWSARFTQLRPFRAGVYQFVARVDDGVRLSIDGNLIINEFREQSARTFTTQAALAEGNRGIVIEYVQFGGDSNLSLYWNFLGNPGAAGMGAMSLEGIPFFPALSP
ncbi:MAG: PA14 domain-containing protein [Anaerolineae bacterium]|nr:PA14 domain-containing protein [Thermoflexales bacterium]MDW8395700.1 PA14 domain-containing protein [Anaerolineae bacterium]